MRIVLGMVGDEWKLDGTISFSGLLADHVWSELDVEASDLAQSALPHATDATRINRDGSIETACCYSRNAGSSLKSLSRSLDLLRAIRDATGISRLVPVGSSYLYFHAGDYAGIHRDSVKATLTLVLTLTPSAYLIRLAPQLRFATTETVTRFIDSQGILPGPAGEDLMVKYHDAVGFDGYNIPHWVPPVSGEPCTVGHITFFDL
jgi:pimeloyl-ACP methyl ester carboxylesterase